MSLDCSMKETLWIILIKLFDKNKLKRERE